MAKLLVYILAVWIAIATDYNFASSKEPHNPAIIHLDFSSVRGHSSSYPWVHPRSAVPNPDDSAVYCSNREFPEDAFCDIGDLVDKKHPDQYVYEFKLKYPTPSTPDEFCYVTLKLDRGDASKLRLNYDHFTCDGPVVKDVPPFKFSDVVKVTISSRRYDNLNHKCFHEFNNDRLNSGAGGKKKVDTLDLPSIVKFVFKEVSCISAISMERGPNGEMIQVIPTEEGYTNRPR